MTAYRVLARKYRPQNFADLIGQEVLVRTLTNAFSSGRIAHAFLLTGIRGIGKTTTARIIARGLNCIGADGNGEPTTQPCGVCPNCKMILEDRHVDVIEMDAASRTGVDDIRELIDTVHYAPAAGRYKVYIIDEVHMLSKNAFNALLKTLEEPPPHVKFIFATTELRKIPVTIISRCQRFDLRRLDTDMLAEHLISVAGKESIALSPECATLIATAAEGSVRDSLSLLDQAIAMSSDADGTTIIAFESLRNMLGLADKTQSFALLAHVLAGEIEPATQLLHSMYNNGVDPAMLLTDLLDIVHYLTRITVSPALAANIAFSSSEQALATAMCEKIDMPQLARTWQMLIKGVDELKACPNLLAALEMVLVRMAYTAQLPTPADVIRRIENNSAHAALTSSGISSSPANLSQSNVHAVSTQPTHTTPLPAPQTTMRAGNLALAVNQEFAPDIAIAPQEILAAEPVKSLETLESFADVVALMEKLREPILTSHLTHDVRLVSFAQHHIIVRPIRHVPADFAARLNRRLSEATSVKWSLSFSEEEGEPSIAEQREAAQKLALNYAASHPRVVEIQTLFGSAEILAFEPNESTK